MKILVINISLRPMPARRSLPVGLAYVVSAMKRGGFQFELLDLDVESQSKEETEKYLRCNRYDIVAMGCIVTGYNHVKWLSSIIKESHPSTIVIVGNTVAQSIPHILLNRTKADIAVMGEADITIVELLRQLTVSNNLSEIKGICYRIEGKVINNPKRPLIKDINTIPTPDWDLFDVEFYIRSQAEAFATYLPKDVSENARVMPINTARGCPHQCTFCFHAFRGEKYRWRSAESIVSEMKYLKERYGVNIVTFNDELTFHSIRQAATFADTVLKSGLQIYWTASCRSGLFCKDEHVDVARKLKEAGCLWLGFSLESADYGILKWMNKKASPADFSRQVELLRKAGITSFTSIVLGYPNETAETIKATIDCCIANGIYPSAGYLLPQPGSPMYDYAREKGFIRDEEAYLLSMGDRQDLRLNMTKIPDREFENIVHDELDRCSRELGLSLSGGALLKTGTYKKTNK
jgi:anaerobic magnesium-protoporphyrin IX monomethyl ester cyclase